MSNPPIKTLVVLAILIASGIGLFLTFRRTPACSGDGKYMSTLPQCQAYGVSESVCREAIDKAKQVALRAAPKSATLFQCESLYSDCFQTPTGEFTPTPSFCMRLSPSGAPIASEVRYLEMTSDRMNRRKAHEVRID
jgi:uncharacterized protein YgiB involved in biofilm formation